MEQTTLVYAPLLGERLRRSREARDMSQAELAEQLALPQSSVVALETGQHPQLDAKTLARVCQVLAVSADYLLGLIDAPRPRRAPDTRARHTGYGPQPGTSDHMGPAPEHP
jgi:transcriptional regulator with XRE-family HTH domain